MHSFFLCMERNKKLKKINLTDFHKREFSNICMILFFLLFSIENTLFIWYNSKCSYSKLPLNFILKFNNYPIKKFNIKSEENIRMQNNSNERYVREKLSTDIDAIISGKYNQNDDVMIRKNTPTILVEHGIKNLPMLMNQNHIKSNILSKTKAKKLGIFNKDNNYHNIGKQAFLKSIESMESPLAIIKSISKNGKQKTYVIVTEVQNEKGEYVIIPVYLETRGNYNNVSIETNKIKTIYGKKDIKDFVDRTIQDDINNIIYLIKDKSKRRLITTTGLQLSN